MLHAQSETVGLAGYRPMNTNTDSFGRVLIFAAHPDDETIACGGLLQRASTSLVLFAADGAPRCYGFEQQFGSLRAYSEERFREASKALGLVPRCSFGRLARKDGTSFADQHLFRVLGEAFTSLQRMARNFSPDLLVSHAFEGGHIDHDACHILAKQTAYALSVPHLEFPLYWRTTHGQDVFQRFRDRRNDEIVLQLSSQELRVKQQMLAEYKTQREQASVFAVVTERFRPMAESDHLDAVWSRYPFENRWRQLRAEVFFRNIVEFRANTYPMSSSTSCSY
jgi:LmbE family N-acetylglucosaminyl deacetylase